MASNRRNPLEVGFFDVFTVPTRRTVTQWADDKRILPSKGAAEPGRYRSARTPYMREPMDCMSVLSAVQECCVMAAAQTGKALAIDTPIPTPHGWAAMGDIKPGDAVFDERGQPTLVTAVSPVQVGRRCFSVLFSDGARVTCDADHLWTVEVHSYGVQVGRETLTTAQLLPGLSCGGRYRYAIETAGALDTPHVDLPIDPYTLGVWLGDGNSASNQFTQGMDDAESIAEHIRSAGHTVDIRVREDGNASCIIDAIRGRTHCQRGHNLAAVGTFYGNKCRECHRQRSNGKGMDPIIARRRFGQALDDLGLRNNKHIPSSYLRASVVQRMALLQGLMDTDGYASQRGVCEFANSNKILLDGVRELLVSLGLKVTVSERHVYKVGAAAVKKGLFLTNWRLSFTAYSDTPVFRLQRKLARLGNRADGRSREVSRRRIVAIEPVSSVPVKCIAVGSESRLYLAGRDMVPTHNSESGNNWVGYVMDEAPGPMLLVQPTVDNAKRYSKQRIGPMIQATPTLTAKVTANRSREGGNTMLEKEFPGGILIMGGANSAAGLRSMPIRYLFADEISNWPLDVDGEGDPLGLAEERTNTFGRKRKVFKTSTPGTKGLCRIEGEYLKSDQRRYFVPCPHCGHMHVLEWANFIIPRTSDGRSMTSKAYMACPECGGVIEERHKTDLLNRGEWRATAPEQVDPTRRGYHISALYSPIGWKSWAKIAKQWVEAQGHPEKLKAFVNNVLAETWEEDYSAKLDAATVRERAETYDLLFAPRGVLVLTAGVDVQQNRIEIQIIGWGEGEEAWVVHYAVIYGEPTSYEVWQQVLDVINTPIRHETGVEMHVYAAILDSSDGNFTHEVYAVAREHRRRHILAGKGFAGSRPPIGAPTKQDINIRGKLIKHGALMYPVGVDGIKSTIYGRLKPRKDKAGAPVTAGPGVIHFPLGLHADYFDQLTAEKQAVKFINGMPKRYWKKRDKDRNEALDTMVYAYSALHYVYSRHNRASFWKQMAERVSKRVSKTVSGLADSRPAVAESTPEQPAAPVQAPVAPSSGMVSLSGWRRR